MPKPAPPKRINWRLIPAVLVGLLLFVSTGMAARYVKSMLLGDERFYLESSFKTAGKGESTGIRIVGNRYTPRDRILQIFAPDVDKSIFRIPLAERRRRLMGIDWISDATVMRVWPNQLIVSVRERQPVAFAKLPLGEPGQFHYRLIDEMGVLLSVPRQRFDFPVLTGVTEDQKEEERADRVSAMEELLRQLGRAASSMIYEINAASTDDIRVAAKIEGHNVELWLGNKNYLSRFQNFTAHLEEIFRQSDGASVFDLRLDDRIMTVR
jgi:cell division protein FtsQ